jgi:hypothetical protein
VYPIQAQFREVEAVEERLALESKVQVRLDLAEERHQEQLSQGEGPSQVQDRP